MTNADTARELSHHAPGRPCPVICILCQSLAPFVRKSSFKILPKLANFLATAFAPRLSTHYLTTPARLHNALEMAKKKNKPAQLHTKDAISRIVSLLDLIKRLRYPNLQKLVEALEEEESFQRFSHRTIIRDIIYLRESCQYPIFYNPEKKGYSLDWKKGMSDGFLPELVKDPATVAPKSSVPGGPKDPPVLPEGESLAGILAWAKQKINRWAQMEAIDPTRGSGILYRGCLILEALLARSTSVLLSCEVRSDDLESHGRFEEQIVWLREADKELTEWIKKRRPQIIKADCVLSAADQALLEDLAIARNKLLNPTAKSLTQQQQEMAKMLRHFLTKCAALVDSELMRICAEVESGKLVFKDV